MSQTSGATVQPVKQPKLPFWQVWNVSLGFLGVQFGFALQNANASRILSDLGADLHSLSLFWIVAPLMGLIVQPIVGSASDRTWNRFGRRNPYILFGAIAAALGMAFMPNAGIVVAFIAPILFGGVMLALMDAAFNVTMQPFRALVSDMVPSEQRTLGYSIQSLLINIGAVFGSMLPFILTNVIGLENTAQAGEVAPSVIWAFYIGASVLLGSVLWTVFRTREYAPKEYNAYKGIDADQLARERAERKSLPQRLGGFFQLLFTMPKTMRQLALVQFFSWFALFIMWVYTTPAITQHVWGVEAKWFDPHYLESVGQVPAHIAAAKGAAGDWVGIIFAAYSLFAALFSIVLARIANTFGRKPTYALSLLLGGLGYISFLLFQGGEATQVNLLITEVTVPSGALGLLLPMVGVGIAWAAILAMPYAILSDSLPASKTGVYMGIFNFTIAAPQIISALVAGAILKGIFDNQAIYIIVLAGVFMILGAVSVSFVREERAEQGGAVEEAVTA
ncbi:maltose/moltooligosaccharide transporter [Microbulbifer donghaiensis]|uniref:Maltose/moltooligosaccharide transporter n=1 Tax=Microbulbifer donghaiensis TaxID=494016 RepID=A0A1M5FCN6_9GAMM|nr:MFS transporter [Microbulbifer donghaiensis]SHF89266.1 maltose/moltooligosaccharide transporter [Microbulbifer donghaiensis]